MGLSEKALEIGTSLNFGNKEIIYDRGIVYPKCSGIYKIKNIFNDKVYVGSAKNLDKRIKNHIWGIYKNKHRNIMLTQAFNKYGYDNFYFIILEICDYEEIVERENLWIDYYQSFKKENGYNIQPFAFSNLSNPLSDSAKQKISNYQKGRPKTKEANIKNSISHMGALNPNYGKKISDNLRRAIILSNKNRNKKNN